MKRLARDVLLMALATGISRVFGLFRDVAIADRFGAGSSYDAFLIAFFLPHFLRGLLAEGALSTAFIPVFTDSLVVGKDANRFASNVLSLLLLLFPIVVAAGILFAPTYLSFLASGFAEEELHLAISLSRLLFPFIALVGFSAVFMGILNGYRRFFVPSLAPVLFNLGMITGALILSPRLPNPIFGLGFGVLIGGAGQLLIQIPALYRAGFRFHFTLLPLHPGVRKMTRLMAPAILGLAVVQINLLVDNKLASHLGEGGISSLQYAMRLFQLPLGMFAVSIASALLPRFSAALAHGDNDRFSKHLGEGISAAAFMLLPAVVGLYVIGGDVIRLLFEHGSFTPAATLRTAHVLSFYLIGLFFYGLVSIFTRAFYACSQTLVPVIASACAVGANIAFDLLLVGPMREAGLAFATSIAGCVNAAVLGAFLWRKFHPDSELAVNLLKIAGGAAVVFLVSWCTRSLTGETSLLLKVVIPITAAVVSYLIYARLSGLWRLMWMGERD